MNLPFKVITEDPNVGQYRKELDSIITKMRIIGISYNEAVKTLNSYHTVATAQRMICNTEVYSEDLLKLRMQAKQLIIVYQAPKEAAR